MTLDEYNEITDAILKGERILDINSVLKEIGVMNGPEKQETFPLEEMAELTKELMKHRRGADNRAEIVEESVDVLYTIRCLLYAYGADDDEIDEVMQRKVKRLAKRVIK